MTTTRRSFFKKACISGACFCGFASLLHSKQTDISENITIDPKEKMYKNWISEILSNLNTKIDEKQLRELIKSAGKSHYEYLQMDQLLAPYIGNLNEFTRFIEKEWGWIFSYEKNGKILIADENKSYCVCPLLNQNKTDKLPALCYCSEGFAEMMFSKVNKTPVKAIIISSIQRGNDKCVYKIHLP